MRVLVNYDLCEGNARCVKVAPAVFQVDDNDQLHLLISEPPEALHAAVENAVAVCPRQALSIDDALTPASPAGTASRPDR
jgi:ferredoxin